MYQGYPHMTPSAADIYGQTPYSRLTHQPTGPFPAVTEASMKTEADTPVSQGYFPNGGFSVISDPVKAHAYYPQPHYSTSVYSPITSMPASGFESEQGATTMSGYDQFRLHSTNTKDGAFEQTTESNHVYWNPEEQDVETNEQPAKRARYSNETFTS